MTPVSRRLAARLLPLAAFVAVFVTSVNAASAQFSPPSTVFGSVTDSGGGVPENLPVEAYIGSLLCGTKGKTQFTGDGAARVTVYFIDVLHESQTPGCGKDGADVRIKIGDRFAPQTTKWRAGPVQLDVTFGNATPAVIPTFTPAPTTPTSTPRPGTTAAAVATAVAGTPSAAGSSQPVGTIPAGSPGAGSPVPTLRGGVTSSTPTAQQADASGGGGFPIWGVVLLVLAGVAALGGGVGYAMSRGRTDGPDDDDLLPPSD